MNNTENSIPSDNSHRSVSQDSFEKTEADLQLLMNGNLGESVHALDELRVKLSDSEITTMIRLKGLETEFVQKVSRALGLLNNHPRVKVSRPGESD